MKDNAKTYGSEFNGNRIMNIYDQNFMNEEDIFSCWSPRYIDRVQ